MLFHFVAYSAPILHDLEACNQQNTDYFQAYMYGDWWIGFRGGGVHESWLPLQYIQWHSQKCLGGEGLRVQKRRGYSPDGHFVRTLVKITKQILGQWGGGFSDSDSHIPPLAMPLHTYHSNEFNIFWTFFQFEYFFTILGSHECWLPSQTSYVHPGSLSSK